MRRVFVVPEGLSLSDPVAKGTLHLAQVAGWRVPWSETSQDVTLAAEVMEKLERPGGGGGRATMMTSV